MTETDLLEKMPKRGYPEHPIAAAFPMMEGKEYTDFVADVAKRGVSEKIVLAPMPDKPDQLGVLDGRNRQAAALESKQPPRFRLFSPTRDGESMVEFVRSHNLHRRHLNASQRAIAASEMLPFFEAEAKANQQAAGGADAAPAETEKGDSIIDASGEFAQAPEKKKEQTQPKKKGHGQGRSTQRAGAAFKVSADSVAKAKALKTSDPEAYEKVKKGGKSLNAATTGKPTKGSAAEKEYNDALERIEKICGRQQVTGIKQGAILRSRKEVVKYAAQTDEKMLAIRQFIDQGWPVGKALNFKAEEIVPTHRIVDLANRTSAAGGTFKQDVHIENAGIVLRITAQIIKGEAVKHRTAKKAAKKKH